MTSDEKLHWLLEQKLLYKFKTDVFFFLKETFNAAGEATQKRIVDTAKEGLVGPEFSQYDPRTLEYEKYNLFIWLNRIAPDCSCVSQELESIRTENPTFRPRENPDLDFWTSGGDREVPDEGFEIASTLANDPKEFLDKFDAWQPRSPIDRSRADNCASLSAAITKDAQWGLSFVKMLVSLGRSDGDLWSAVCQGWRNAELSNQLWGQILTFTLTAPAPNEFYEAFVDVLEHGTRRETFALPEAEMDQAEAIAIRIWNSVLRQTPVEDNTMKDWLAMAINRPGGKLAEFWLQRLSSARKEAGDSWAGFRHSMSEALTEIIAGTSGPAAHARVVFASQFHYLHALDPAFATQTILPLFDWKIDVVRAEQSWHGFLYWGRWPKALHTQLLPLFDETINRAGQFPKELRERIADWIALVAIFVIDDPLAWIMSAVGTINEEMRDQLASAIHQQLEAADPTQGERLWDRWLRKYWETRLLNIPKPLTQEEMSQMLCWALYVGSRFNQATQLAMAFGERASFKGDSFLYRLNKSGRPKSDPQPTADLLLYYLKHTTDLFAGHVTEIWTSLAASGLAASQIQAIREEMFRLGHDPVAT